MEDNEQIRETEVPKEAIAYIRRNVLDNRLCEKSGYDRIKEKEHLVKGEYLSVCDATQACRVALDNQWIKLSERPLEEGVEVIGYNKWWIDPDFNPNGTRIGFLNGDGHFTSAKWNNSDDVYDTMWEEGDDYFASQTQEDGSVKRWCGRPDGGEMLGARPNMPTHYMFIPKHP